ncbi:transcription initiation factor TFIID TATA-box-binding protein [Schistosoma bovis]|uniref:Transcription initiation factor TFIID TATA-box-binding protein n=1 Tax=Schistosoma bovis TaxID=6184 RepID=A0A430QAC3_SCHBO|nr:transcription initiation factor TFIID TATA-box-binding protein [Schistosoma bovis]
MQTNELINGITETEDSSYMESGTDILDFLNTSDTENEDIKDIIGNEPDKSTEEDPCNEEASSLTLSITNVVVMASLQCHLRLKEIARTSVNVEYKPLQNHVIMRLRSPYTVATIWSSGKIWCTGANSLAKAKIGARRIARRIAKCGFPCHFSKYRVVNIMATCKLPFGVRLEELVNERPMQMRISSLISIAITSFMPFLTSGSSLDSIGTLVEELVPIAALHQTDEPVPDANDIQERDEAHVVLKAARYMNMLPNNGGFNGLVYDIDDEYENSDESDFYEDVGGGGGAQHSFSTDDSTDSGASIDSGGVSTKVKRRIKKKSRLSTVMGNSISSTSQLRSYDSLRSGSPLHLLTPREAASLAFSKRAAGNIEDAKDLVATAGELRRQRELLLQRTTQDSIRTESRSNFSQSDPTWSRKAVASGSTKRACVVTYSGTEDSESQDLYNTVELRSQGYTQSNVSSIEQQQHQQQLKIIHAPSLMPLNSTNPPVQVSTVMTPVNTAANSLQYVLIKPSTSIGQTVYNNVMPTVQPTFSYTTTPCVTPIQTNSIVQLSLPLSNSGVDGQNLITTSTASSASVATTNTTVYPIRLSNNILPNYISSVNDGKVSLKFIKYPSTNNNSNNNNNSNAVIIKLQ